MYLKENITTLHFNSHIYIQTEQNPLTSMDTYFKNLSNFKSFCKDTWEALHSEDVVVPTQHIGFIYTS